MRIRQADLETLIPDPANPRRMTESQARKLVSSLETFGAVEPAIFNTRTGQVVGGHQRIEAARVLGWAKFPTIDVDLSETQQRQLNLALNRISGDWDTEKLTEMLGELAVEGAQSLELTGFEEGELARLLVDGTEEKLHGQLDPRGFQIVIECDGEAHQAEILTRLQGEGLSARAVML